MVLVVWGSHAFSLVVTTSKTQGTARLGESQLANWRKLMGFVIVLPTRGHSVTLGEEPEPAVSPTVLRSEEKKSMEFQRVMSLRSGVMHTYVYVSVGREGWVVSGPTLLQRLAACQSQ